MEYYEALLQGIKNAHITGSSSITGLLIAKKLYEELVLKDMKKVQINEEKKL